MKVQEMRQKRAGLIAQARTLVDKVDAESRDFTDEERTQYVALMGEDNQGGEIAQLAKVIQDREDLEKLEAELSQPNTEPVKPDGNSTPKLMKRAAFDGLDQLHRAAFVQAGGIVED